MFNVFMILSSLGIRATKRTKCSKAEDIFFFFFFGKKNQQFNIIIRENYTFLNQVARVS